MSRADWPGTVLIVHAIVHYHALMGVDAQSLAALIGSRVRRERTDRGWTLDHLAELADVSRRMIVSVEQGAVNPSIGTLLRLSEALSLGLPTLVAPPHQDRVKLIRAGDGAALWKGASGGQGVLLAGTEPPNVVELWDWTLAPGEAHASDAHSQGTRELLHVHEGRLVVTVANATFTLCIGDALSFVGDEKHSYANPGDVLTRFSLTVYEPVGGSGHQKETKHA